MKLLTTLLSLPLLLAAACTPSGSGSLGPGPSAAPLSTPAEPSPALSLPLPLSPEATPPATDGRMLTIQVWFHRGGKHFATTRTRPVTQATSHLALTELIAGPSNVERDAGVGSYLATGTRFEIKGIADGTETVSFPASFYQGEGNGLRMRQAQVVYTLTQFRGVQRVAFLADGAPTFGGPFGRADMADLLPDIVVFSPVIGQRVTSPVTVSGIADVYEATVSMRVLDSSGKEIGAKFATATCTRGCHGAYSVAMPYRGCVQGPGTVQVYESSPVDGSRINVVDIPVQLAGCSQ